MVWFRKKTKQNPKFLILQFHRVDQYFSLNENLLPSEMQTKLCSFSLLFKQRPHSLPDYTSQTSRAGNITLSQHICFLPLGTRDSVLSQRMLFEMPIFHPGITSSHPSLPLLTGFLPFPLSFSYPGTHCTMDHKQPLKLSTHRTKWDCREDQTQDLRTGTGLWFPL